MAVPVVIDGYNLLYARGDAPSASTRARLVRDLVQWAGARRRRVLVVFDAWDQGGREAQDERRGPVTVRFTRHGERADAEIVRWVTAHPEAVVVTSDRAVGQGARRRGAAVLAAAAFAGRLAAVVSPEDDEEEEKAESDDEPRGGRGGGRQAAWLRGL